MFDEHAVTKKIIETQTLSLPPISLQQFPSLCFSSCSLSRNLKPTENFTTNYFHPFTRVLSPIHSSFSPLLLIFNKVVRFEVFEDGKCFSVAIQYNTHDLVFQSKQLRGF